MINTPSVVDIYLVMSAITWAQTTVIKRVPHPWTLFLTTSCFFSEVKINFGQRIRWNLLKMFQGTHKLHFYFSRDRGYEVTVTGV